jgi:hypothetical protein
MVKRMEVIELDQWRRFTKGTYNKDESDVEDVESMK